MAACISHRILNISRLNYLGSHVTGNFSCRQFSHILVNSKGRDVFQTRDQNNLKVQVLIPTRFNVDRTFQLRTLSSESSSGGSSFFKYLSESTPAAYAKDVIVSFHDTTGLPWWLSIMVSTIILRTCLTFPMSIYQSYILAKVENLAALEMPDLAKNLQREIAIKARTLNWTPAEATIHFRRAVKKQWNTLIVRDNCHPGKASLTVWFQIPTWVFFSTALRNMAFMLPQENAEAQLIFLQLSVGGFLWIPNLTQSDGSLILPLLLGVSNLAIIEIQSMMRLREPSRFQRYVQNFFRAFSIVLVPLSATIPSCVTLYWTTSSLLGLGQNLLLMSNKFRRICRIPDTPSTLDHPYLHLWMTIKNRVTFVRK